MGARRGMSTGAAAGLVLLLTAVALPAGNASGADRSDLVQQGEAVFREQCSPCHTLGGGDRPMGPDLAGVTGRRERPWLLRTILEPGELIAEGNPAALELEERYGMAMPDLGLSEQEAEAVLAFLERSQETGQPPEKRTAGSPPPVPEGDPHRGEALYVGAAGFEKGGAPCLACHGIAGHGLGGGASLGPDLTTFHDDYGPEGIASVLESLPFPSMAPIYDERPLTEAERADLSAFFAGLSGTGPVRVGAELLLHALAGSGLLLAILFLAGRKRLLGVRRPLVEKSRRQRGGEKR